MSDTEAKVLITADASGVSPGIEKAINELNKLPPMALKMKSAFTEATQAGRLSAQQVSQLANEFTGALDKQRAAVEKVQAAGHASAGALRESLVLIREAANQNWTRFAGSVSLLAQYTGALKLVMTPLGGIIAGATAAVAAFGFAALQGEEDARKFQNMMSLTGNQAGLTSGQYESASIRIATASKTGVGVAREALLALANTGQFSGQTLENLGAVTVRMAQLSGKSADDIAKDFARMGEGATEYALKYQHVYGQLTAAQIDHIRKLEEQGDKEAALLALSQDLYGYYGSQAPQNLGLLESAWQSLGHSIDAAWEAMKGFMREKTDEQQLAALKNQLATELQFQPGAHDPALEKQIAALQTAINLAHQKAADDAASATAQKEGAAAAQDLAQRFEQSRSTGQKLRVELEKINQELAKAVKADPGNRAKLEQEAEGARAQARASFTPKAAKPQSQMGALREALDRELDAKKSYFDESNRLEEDYWRKVLETAKLSLHDRFEVEHQLHELNKQDARRAYQDQIEDLKTAEAQKVDAIKATYEGAKANFDDQREAVKAQAAEELITKTQLAQKLMEIDRADRDAALKSLADEHAAKLAAINAEIAAAAAVGADQSRLNAQKLQEEAAYQLQRVTLATQADRKIAQDQIALAQAMTDAQNKAINAFSQNFAAQFAKLATLQQGFAATMRGVWQSVLSQVEQSFTAAFARMLETQLRNLILSKAAEKATGIAQVQILAGRAGAGAMAATASIPFIGPALAPAAGAVAYAATMAFLPSASKGFDVPQGTSPLTQLHEKEMVLPAQYADVIRNMDARGGARGDVHLHVHATDADSVKRLFRNNGSALADVLRDLQRNNRLAGVRP